MGEKISSFEIALIIGILVGLFLVAFILIIFL